MPHEIQGELTVAKESKFALVVSRFNDFVTSRLTSGSVDTLTRHGCVPDNITCIRVPGTFEIAFAARQAAASGQYDAVICLGCVIRGQTPHFEYVASEATRGIGQTGLETGVPVTFGVVTADTLEQAIERAGSKAGNRGSEAAISAIEMVNLKAKLATGK